MADSGWACRAPLSLGSTSGHGVGKEMVRFVKRNKVLVVLGTLALALFSGCSELPPDRRLTEDQQSCQAMGHAPETAIFKECMVDLNKRRCAMFVSQKGNQSHHVPSTDCTRLN